MSNRLARGTLKSPPRKLTPKKALLRRWAVMHIRLKDMDAILHLNKDELEYKNIDDFQAVTDQFIEDIIQLKTDTLKRLEEVANGQKASD